MQALCPSQVYCRVQTYLGSDSSSPQRLPKQYNKNNLDTKSIIQTTQGSQDITASS